ncbi:hypothetical protein [Hydrogenophaga sp. 2FB]|uniref:hypothetical protein n=1 Tax=Hydrogenophaga sp. 2FB TaxID=2502187 RepID=UPI0010F55DED|nr:hypothetical protein [Hydrogenophaga sp. 2FB]
MTTTSMNQSLTPAHAVGFTIMKAGHGSDLRACLVTPYGGRIEKVEFVNERVELRVSNVDVHLFPIPADVRDLIQNKPENVLLISVDTLSRVRQATALGNKLMH